MSTDGKLVHLYGAGHLAQQKLVGGWRARRREREEWIDEVLASDLQPKLKVLAVRIARHKNDRTGQCNPAVPTLAQGIGQHERTVQRWLPMLREVGWIDYTDNLGGQGKSTQFTLTKPRHKCVTLPGL